MDPFHLALSVHDLAQARAFYGELLQCPEGRSAPTWVDFDFFGHQLSVHLQRAPERSPSPVSATTSPVDGDAVPMPHFGLVLDMPRWESLAERLRAAGTAFVIEPRVRFRGRVGEQATLFLRDPSGNALEFKAFADRASLFERPPSS
jgi:extradiol dioxygenase family protein